MENLPIFISLLFFGAFVICILFFYLANGRAKQVSLVIITLSAIQSILALQGFYENTNAIPPRFTLVLIPSTLLIIYGLLPRQLGWVRKVRNVNLSTFLHIVRIPVEIVLYNLYLNELIPELMTFEGRNYDIIIGITAPLMAFLYSKRRIGTKVLVFWNMIGLFFVLFIMINAVLSFEVPFQQFAFDQPNIAVKYFPFILLPVVIVPIVIWTHISDIIYLIKLKAT